MMHTKKMKLTALMFVMHFTLALAQEHVVFDEKSGNITSNDLWIPKNTEELKGLSQTGPFIRLQDGGILTVNETKSFISRDEGKTWEERQIFSKPEAFKISGERVLLQTKTGVVIMAFMNMKEATRLQWNKEISDFPEAILPTYVARSLDGGKTWQEAKKLHNTWTGAVRTIIETRNGNIVFTSMMMMHNPCHHTVLTYTSFNDGLDWTRSNIIDLGGKGDHSGVTESTIVQLNDGRIWQLIRTNWGTFWEAFSEDEGVTWKSIRTSNIDASSAPGLLKRMESGRLVLLWNRRFPFGKNTYPFRGGDGQFSEISASNHREELSIAFSDNDGKTWSAPKVIAKMYKVQNVDRVKSWIAYPFAFEAKPGELWITTMQGGLKMKLQEKDFIDVKQ